MSDSQSHDDSAESPLDRALAEYFERIDRGENVDTEQFAAEHPDLADELKSYFDTAGPVEAIAAHLDKTSDFDPSVPISLTRSGGLDGYGQPLGVIRYFGDYELLEEIARGGMGVVYKARQVSLNRIVAVKMILAGQLASEDDVKRFHTEAEAAANLDHPGIVPIYEVDQHDSLNCFSMGFVEGESLARRLAEGPLAARRAAELTKEVAAAVHYAHGQRVIHRDLKPANVLLDEEGHARITDFGLAKRVDVDSNITATGQILGTPSFMPPEQAAGKLNELEETADV